MTGAVELLCDLTHKLEPSLRLNGVWGLMNLSFNAEERIKEQIMTTLGTDQVMLVGAMSCSCCSICSCSSNGSV